jgi:hypothetical protein
MVFSILTGNDKVHNPFGHDWGSHQRQQLTWTPRSLDNIDDMDTSTFAQTFTAVYKEVSDLDKSSVNTADPRGVLRIHHRG